MKNFVTIFDVDDTLLATTVAKAQALEVLVKFANFRIGEEDFFHAVDFDRARKLPQFRSTPKSARRASINWLVRKRGLSSKDMSDFGDELFELMTWQTYQSLKLIDRSVRLMQAFNDLGCIIVISTNGVFADHPLVNRLPIVRSFTSMSIGAYKPAPEFFRRLIGLMNYPRATVISVGDSFLYDVIPAIRGGAGGGLYSKWSKSDTITGCFTTKHIAKQVSEIQIFEEETF